MLERQQIISTLAELLGLLAVVAGVAQLSVPAAFIVGGLALSALGYALGLEDRR